MTPDVFQGTDAVDQWTFDSTDRAEARLQQHWSTYITEGDFQNMSSWGINAVRIPIGYWAYNNSGTPYITGADAYLETAIGWARQHGIWVMIDCHGSPGSQTAPSTAATPAPSPGKATTTSSSASSSSRPSRRNTAQCSTRM